MSKFLVDEMPTQPMDCPFASPDIETSNYICNLTTRPDFCTLIRRKSLKIYYECPYLRALSDYEDDF